MSRFIDGYDVASTIVILLLIAFIVLSRGGCWDPPDDRRVVVYRDTVVKKDTVLRYYPPSTHRVPLPQQRDTVRIETRTRDTLYIYRYEDSLIPADYLGITFHPRPDSTFRDTVRIVQQEVIVQGPTIWEKLLYIAIGVVAGILFVIL